jgi:GT2 family glycosyltransferase
MVVRREAVERVGYCDEDYFLFSEETDWCFRFREAGWKVVFFPGAECVHVRGAAHGGRLYRENLRGLLLFLWKHHGPKTAERARRLLLTAVRLQFRGERGWSIWRRLTGSLPEMRFTRSAMTAIELYVRSRSPRGSCSPRVVARALE